MLDYHWVSPCSIVSSFGDELARFASIPLSLPEGTEVRVQIEPVDPAIVSNDDSQDKDSDESEDFANLPCFGMWADREDMRDSVAWVRKQREKWKERLTRTE